jgi:spermidine synthase
VAVASLVMAARRRQRPGKPVPDAAATASGSQAVYWVIAISGLTALGAEVVWTRLLSLMLGATVYTFSILLAVFLVGLGIGSAAGSLLSRRLPPRIALGCCQIALAAAILWTAFLLARVLPYWHVNPKIIANAWLKFRLDFGRCLLTLLPATFFWGASVPLGIAAASERRQDPGRWIGRVYAANTAGAILGAVAFSLLLIPGVGTQQSQRILILLAVLAAMLALKPRFAAPAVLAALLAWAVPAVPWPAVAWAASCPRRR